jgi:PhnB protein
MEKNTSLVPMLYMQNLADAIDFYTSAFGATERWRVDNSDGSTHVAEMIIDSVIFRLHEEVSRDNALSPTSIHGTTVVVGLLVSNPDEIFNQAVAAGATVVSGMKDYEYNYRQGTLQDPFGHLWCLEKSDGLMKTPFMPK